MSLVTFNSSLLTVNFLQNTPQVWFLRSGFPFINICWECSGLGRLIYFSLSFITFRHQLCQEYEQKNGDINHFKARCDLLLRIKL
jgi:uncharacterized membrane protein YkgB